MLVHADGTREVILPAPAAVSTVRTVARKLQRKLRFGRKVVIVRDGRDLPGGANGLDDQAYQDWLQEHTENE